MLIPNDDTEREFFYEDLIQQCFASRADRATGYERLKNYYLFGSGDGTDAPFNKINATVDIS